jgi:hypothetical protein
MAAPMKVEDAGTDHKNGGAVATPSSIILKYVFFLLLHSTFGPPSLTVFTFPVQPP